MPSSEVLSTQAQPRPDVEALFWAEAFAGIGDWAYALRWLDRAEDHGEVEPALARRKRSEWLRTLEREP